MLARIVARDHNGMQVGEERVENIVLNPYETGTCVAMIFRLSSQEPAVMKVTLQASDGTSIEFERLEA